MEMTDAQEEIVQPIIEARSPGEDPRCRKPSEQRPILEGILWVDTPHRRHAARTGVSPTVSLISWAA